MSEVTQRGWTETPPTEMGDYWFWDGDEDHRPVPVSVSARMGGVVVGWQAGDLDMWPVSAWDDGWWKPLPLPEPPPGKEVSWSKRPAGEEGEV